MVQNFIRPPLTCTRCVDETDIKEQQTITGTLYLGNMPPLGPRVCNRGRSINGRQDRHQHKVRGLKCTYEVDGMNLEDLLMGRVNLE